MTKQTGNRTFADMLAAQEAFQTLIGDMNLQERQRVERIGQMVLLGHAEASDMMALLGYKTHQTFKHPEWDNALHEWVDQFKYVLAQAAVAGFTADDIIAAFDAKSVAVEERWRRAQSDLESQPVAVFDIDGVLCRYDDLTYDEIAAGAFARAVPHHEMIQMTWQAATMGYKVVLVTSRKDYRWRRIVTDTELWLKMHNVHYDRLIFAYDKAQAVWGLNVEFAVEDSDKHAIAYANARIPTCLIVGVGDWVRAFNGITAVRGVEAAAEWVKERLMMRAEGRRDEQAHIS